MTPFYYPAVIGRNPVLTGGPGPSGSDAIFGETLYFDARDAVTSGANVTSLTDRVLAATATPPGGFTMPFGTLGNGSKYLDFGTATAVAKGLLTSNQGSAFGTFSSFTFSIRLMPQTPDNVGNFGSFSSLGEDPTVNITSQNNYIWFARKLSSLNLSHERKQGGSLDSTSSGGTLYTVDSAWHTAQLVWTSGVGVSFYWDNVDYRTVFITSVKTFTAGVLPYFVIGNRPDIQTVSRPWSGYIGNVRFFTSALDSTQRGNVITNDALSWS